MLQLNEIMALPGAVIPEGAGATDEPWNTNRAAR